MMLDFVVTIYPIIHAVAMPLAVFGSACVVAYAIYKSIQEY